MGLASTLVLSWLFLPYLALIWEGLGSLCLATSSPKGSFGKKLAESWPSHGLIVHVPAKGYDTVEASKLEYDHPPIPKTQKRRNISQIILCPHSNF